MKKYRCVLVLLCASIFLTLSVTESTAGNFRGRKPPGPSLVAPGDNEDVTGKDTLEFRWGPEGDSSSFDHYDFRLYKGHELVEAGLLLQKDIPMGQNSIMVETSLFKHGKTYTWSVRLVGSSKSRVSYSVFRVIKEKQDELKEPQ